MVGRIATLVGACLAWAMAPGCSISIDFSNTNYQCSSGDPCPSGYSCNGSSCVLGGPDAGRLDAAIDGGGEPRLSCGNPELIRESFTTAVPWWAGPPGGTDGVVAISGGRLRIDASSVLGERTNFGDKFHTTLVGNRMSVELTALEGADFYFSYGEFGFVEIKIEGGMLIGVVQANNTTTQAAVPFEPAVHRFFSLRENDGTISAEASTDGVEWTVVHERVGQFSMDFGHVDMGVVSTGPGGFAEVDNINGGGDPLSVACELPDTEDFEDGTINLEYTGYELDCALAVTGGLMRWTLSNEGGVEPSCGLDPVFRHDLHDNTFGVEVMTVPAPSPTLYFYIELISEGGTASFYVREGDLTADYCATNCNEVAKTPLSSTAHRFWRFRHDASGLNYETSSDGDDWVMFGQIPDPIDFRSTQVQLRFGSDEPVASVVEFGSFGPMP